MKLIFAMFTTALLLAASDPQVKQTDKPAAPAKEIKPLEIPKGAVETDPGTFRYTDSDGKKWIYRKTPWGVARKEDNGTEAVKETARPAGEGITAVEDGDMVRFERPGPFGVYKWEKKKSELNENESAALERARALAKAKQD